MDFLESTPLAISWWNLSRLSAIAVDLDGVTYHEELIQALCTALIQARSERRIYHTVVQQSIKNVTRGLNI